MSTTTETETKYRVRLFADYLPESPRDWDHFSRFAGWHRRSIIGDEQPTEDPADWIESLEPDSIILPVYMYEHSGVAFSTGSFGCPWDSGQVGYIVAEPSAIREHWKGHPLPTPDAIRDMLRSEIEVYSQWASGEVYGFVLERWDPCPDCPCSHCPGGSWETEDSCGGFYGSDWAENGLLDHLGAEHADLLESAEVEY